MSWQPSISKVPLSVIKEKQPVKLLEYYEHLYFRGKAPWILYIYTTFNIFHNFNLQKQIIYYTTQTKYLIPTTIYSNQIFYPNSLLNLSIITLSLSFKSPPGEGWMGCCFSVGSPSLLALRCSSHHFSTSILLSVLDKLGLNPRGLSTPKFPFGLHVSLVGPLETDPRSSLKTLWSSSGSTSTFPVFQRITYSFEPCILLPGSRCPGPQWTFGRGRASHA